MTQTKLTESQRALLSRAAAAEDGFADAFEADTKVVTALIRRGLLIRLSTPGEPERVMVTGKGRQLVTPEGPPKPTAKRVQSNASHAGTAAVSAIAPLPDGAPGGKLGVVAGLLRRPKGATIGQLMAATSWQAHSVRGALSGALKKKWGLAVISEAGENGRRYRIAPETRA